MRYLVMALALCACTQAESVCPEVAQEMFPGATSMQGIKINANNSMVILVERDDVPDVRAYICRGDDVSGWHTYPIGIIRIDKNPAERPTP